MTIQETAKKAYDDDAPNRQLMLDNYKASEKRQLSELSWDSFNAIDCVSYLEENDFAELLDYFNDNSEAR